MANKNLLENDDQFVISYELLHILHWILKYEKKELMQLLERAFQKGSDNANNNHDMYEQIQESDKLQNSIVDFFAFLEDQVAFLSNNQSTSKMMQGKLSQTLDHIDQKAFDPSIITSSMKTTAEKISPQKKQQAKELFLKELLKQWKPKKDNSN